LSENRKIAIFWSEIKEEILKIPGYIPREIRDLVIQALGTPTPPPTMFFCVYFIRQGKYLFGLPSELGAYLREGGISRNLVEAFSSHGYLLSGRSRTYREDINTWLIFDEKFGRRYIIVEDDDVLNVYEDEGLDFALVLKLGVEDAIFLEDAMLKGKIIGMATGERVSSGYISIMFTEEENAIISIPQKGLFLGLHGKKEYNKLLRILTGYLDHANLNEEQRRLRDKLRKLRSSEMIQAFK